MCGITGIIGPAGSVGVSGEVGSVDRSELVEPLLRMRHRGPDGTGTSIRTLGWGYVVLGMNRLAIVDRRTIPVPYVYVYLGLVLAYNGEIYNWRELRDELSDGTPWVTACDAEVVARAWRRWGVDCCRHFNGMFAFAITDLRDDQVFLARDRAGEKPLYYTVQRDSAGNDQFAFASEIKGLAVNELIEKPCVDAEIFEYDCLDSTPFAGVQALPPGHCLLIESYAGVCDPRPQAWWSLPDEVDEVMTWERACGMTEALLVSAIRIRAAAEVPVAALVSGGLDSAIIQTVARLPQAFVVFFSDVQPAEELRPAIAVTETSGSGTLARVKFDLAQALEALPRIAWHLDTPATWSSLALFFLCQKIAGEHHVVDFNQPRQPIKVVLSGEGADELFGGYSRYRILWRFDQLLADESLQGYGSYIRHMLCGTEADGLFRMIDRGGSSSLKTDARRYRFNEAILPLGGSGSMAECMMRIDFHTTMQVLLRMFDRMTSAFSLEGRSPFLDYRLVEHAAQIPIRWKIGENGSKLVLREVARRLGVPASIVDQKNKTGLVVPWNKWRGVDRAVGSRGAYDRGDFARTMRDAWRKSMVGRNFIGTAARVRSERAWDDWAEEDIAQEMTSWTDAAYDVTGVE